jgi:hypothetical protein
LQAIRILENPRIETNIRVWSFTHVSTIKKKPIEVKSHERQVENNP